MIDLRSKSMNHGGPLVPGTMHLLPTLNKEQLLLEVRYLRATVAPEIKERQKDEATGKMPVLPEAELRLAINSCCYSAYTA